MIEQLLEYNREFVKSGAYEKFQTSKYPDKKIAILTCMDTRLVELLPAALGIRNGDVKMIKNAGGMITGPFDSAVRSLLVGIVELGVEEVMVIGHTDCGVAHINADMMIRHLIQRGVSQDHIDMMRYCGIDFEEWLRGFDCVESSVAETVDLLLVGRPETVTAVGDLSYSFIKVIPYLLVLILALVGMNVFLVLTIGIFAAGIVGIATGSMDLAGFAQAIYNGFCGMNEVFFLTLLCGGLSELITKNGGIEWIIQKLHNVMKGNKSAQVGIAAMVSLCDCATANNTVAIIVAGDMARQVSHEYKVDPRRTASLLDVFSCVFQGIIPYGAQLLTAAALCNATVTNGSVISGANILGSLWYCWFLAAFGLLSIFIPFADGVCRKDPWNWEYDCAESNVAAKKALMEKEAAEANQ